MTTEQQPVFLSAETGFIIRNLLLGKFAEAVMMRRPLVAAVKNPSDDRLLKIATDKSLSLVPYLYKEETDYIPRSRMQKLTAWQTYIQAFKTAEKSTTTLRLGNRRRELGRSPIGKAGRRTLAFTGKLLKWAGLMGFVEGAYLNHIANLPITAQWRRMLEDLNPAVVISTTLTLATVRRPSHDLALVVAAHQAGVPCGTLVQSWDNLSSKTGVLPSWLDRYWTWSRAMSEELLTLHPRINAEDVKIVGSPQFDHHLDPDLIEPRESYLRQLGLDPERLYILFGTGTPSRLPSEPQTIIALVQALQETMPDCQVLVRLHPKDDGARWVSLRNELHELGTVIQETAPPTDMDAGDFTAPKEFFKDQINAITHAAVVVNASSTLTVDAAILDRPAVCVGYDFETDPEYPDGKAWTYTHLTHYASLVATGGVTVVRSTDECVQAIERYLENPDLLRKERRRIAEMVAGEVDGRAGERLATEALTLAKRHSKKGINAE